MSEGFFTDLPLEITIDILSRLPPSTIISCKCVCKSWLELLDSNEFVRTRLAKSPHGIAIYRSWPGSVLFLEFEDGENFECHDFHYYRLTKFKHPFHATLLGSANGLLFLRKSTGISKTHYVYNPFTRDYIKIRFPKHSDHVTYGFGASKITGQYKVVRISHGDVIDQEPREPKMILPEFECHVYTLGLGSWRRVEPGAPFFNPDVTRVFLNGNLHWLVLDSDSKMWISCFDLETERFSIFSIPPVHQENFALTGGLSALGDCLCFCDHPSINETVIWLMKEYGIEKSWSKEYVLNMNDVFVVCPMKVFKDGDILMSDEDFHPFYYCNKTQTAQQIDVYSRPSFESILFTPSFVSLKSLKMENVISF